MNNPTSPLYFITGISGSGKTTVARKLVELGEVALDSKTQKGLFHFADSNGRPADSYLPQDPEWTEHYHWRLNKPLFDELIQKYATTKRIFLCGGADDLMNYWNLGEKVFMLRVDKATLLHRLNREDRENQFGKDKETQATLLERLERRQQRYLTAGAIPIDACRPVEIVVEDILAQAS